MALVVSRSAVVDLEGFDNNFDADDENFLFPDADDNSAFPNRRDLLFAEFQPMGSSESFFVMVQHTKARYGGRHTTTPRRVENARQLVLALRERFADDTYVIVGDFNDSPDDAALNILEEGDLIAPAAIENHPGAFMINLTEPLWAQGQCTWGHNTTAIRSDGQTVELIDTGARVANFAERNSDSDSFYSKNLFDQILIGRTMKDHYIADSIEIFNGSAGVRNGSRDRASDHLPVYADFLFEHRSTVVIAAALPDPVGTDAGNEKVVLENRSERYINLAGWRLEDRAGNTLDLSGSIGVRSQIVIIIPANNLPLNQAGDTISLYDKTGSLHFRVTYESDQVAEGQMISFER